MKCSQKNLNGTTLSVTSYAEVWIEIFIPFRIFRKKQVTSYAEVWIEITTTKGVIKKENVTSYAEVWIEIDLNDYIDPGVYCHLLRGGVD